MRASGETLPKNVVDRVFSDIRGRPPWTTHAEWVGAVRLDPERLQAAAVAAVRRHPLLRARDGTEPSVWVLRRTASSVAVEHEVAESPAAVDRARDAAVSQPFALSREPPVRFSLVRGPLADHVLVVADHAVVDGVGVGRILLSLRSAYENAADMGAVDESWRESHAIRFAPVSPERIATTARTLLSQARPTAVRLVPGGEPYSGPAPAGSGDEGYGVVYHDMSAGARGRLATPSAGSATPGDLLVAAFGLAGMAWNRARGAPDRPFSIGVPLNLRPARRWLDGVCNATIPWPVRLDQRDADGVLSQVRRQLTPVRLGLYSPDVRAMLGYLTSRTTLSVRARHALATTTVVSIVPVPDEASMLAGRLYGGAPAPTAMGITFAAVADRGGWRLSARYLRSRWSRQGAASLLGSVDDQLLDLCPVGGRPGTPAVLGGI